MVLGGEPPGRVGRRRDFSGAPAARAIAAAGAFLAFTRVHGRYARIPLWNGTASHGRRTTRQQPAGTPTGEGTHRVVERPQGRDRPQGRFGTGPLRSVRTHEGWLRSCGWRPCRPVPRCEQQLELGSRRELSAFG